MIYEVLITTYPLVNNHIAIENGHRNSGFTHQKMVLTSGNPNQLLSLTANWGTCSPPYKLRHQLQVTKTPLSNYR